MKKYVLILFPVLWILLVIAYIVDPGRLSTRNVLNATSSQTAKDYMLSSLNVTAIAQDMRGLVWIGTSAGINIYDGKNYIQFFHDRNDTTALPDDYINVLHLDRKGRMWVGTQNGLARYEGGGLFRRYRLPSGENITGITDAAGCPAGKLSTDTAAIVASTSRRAYLLADGAEPQLLPPAACATKPTAHLSIPTVPEWILNKPKDLISTTFRDKYGNLWIGYHNAGYQILSTNRVSFRQANDNILARETEGRDITVLERVGRHILAGTTLRLYVYDTEQDRMNYTFYKDLFCHNRKDGTTEQNGKEGKDGKENSREGNRIQGNSKQNNGHTELTAILPIDGHRAWLLSHKEVQECRIEGTQIVARSSHAAPAGILYGAATVSGGDAYVCTNSKWLVRFRHGSSMVDSIRVESPWYNDESQITPLANGTLLVAMKNMHLALIHPSGGKAKLLTVKGDSATVNSEPAFIMQDSHRNIWLGTKRSGLYRIDLKSLTAERMTFLNDVHIQAMEEDRLGRLWITTLKDAVCYVPTTAEVLMNSLVSSSQNNWNRQFFDNSICLSPKGNIILGSSDGCKFVPAEGDMRRENAMVKQAAQQLTVYSLRIETQEGKKLSVNDGMANGHSYTLAHDENTLDFGYFYPNYSHRSSLMYQYMLEGYDKEWHTPSYLHDARYANLPPGSYTFRLRLVASPTLPPVAACSVDVRIKPAPWSSAAAWLLYIGITAWLIWFINSLYLRIRTSRMNFLQEQHEREREQRTNEMNMNFFANISHEFRNPLTIIAGPLLSLKTRENLPTDTRRTINRICMSVNRMLRLIDQMLDFNQLEADALRLRVADTDATEEMEKLIEAFSDSARMKHIVLQTDIPDGKCQAWIDTDKLEKIMSNLFTNALKHTPEDGTIKISMHTVQTAKGRSLSISVLNSGPHISEARLEDVFKRYYQLTDTRTGHHYGWGAGIGLYYVKRLVDLHHGHIAVQNVSGTSTGVEFCFTLPIDAHIYNKEEKVEENHRVLQIPVDREENEKTILQEEGTQQASEEEENNSTKAKILIVDDDIDVAHYIRSIFAGEYIIENRYSAEAALADMETLSPDIILSDVIMGKMSGYDFCRTLKESAMYCHIPVVLITAKADVSEQIDGLRTGAVAYVTKPFSPAYLKAIVASQLKNVQTLRRQLTASTDTDQLPESVADTLSAQDRQFMDDLYSYMEKRIAMQELNVATISRDLLISQSKFSYKLKELTGETPGAFIRHYKLNRAAQLLKEGKYNVSEIATITGFATAAHFTVAFKKQFGVSPSSWCPASKPCK